jgi:hypothetical protein
MDALSALLLSASCLVVLVAVAPSLIRAIAGTDLFGATPVDDVFHERRHAGSDETGSHEPAVEGNPHLFFPPADPSPHGLGQRSRRESPGTGLPAEEEETDFPLGSLRLGIVRETVRLLDRPDPGGSVRGEIGPGESVLIVKEAGDWMLVQGTDSAAGWARKAQIFTGSGSAK